MIKLKALLEKNLLATLLFNIKAFGLTKGLQFPVYVYGHIKMNSIGNIVIKCPITRGLIKIGVNHETVAAPYTIFENKGTVEIYGRLLIGYGSVFNNSGTVILRGNNLLSNKVELDIRTRLDVGENTFVGFESHIYDSDFHNVVDVSTHRVYRNCAPIVLGKFNWFGGNTFIKKGTVTPNYLIVASPNSLLAKDYSTLPPYTVLAGCPAKPVKQGIRRIYNYTLDSEISNYFIQHPEEKYYQVDEQADLDDICRY